MTEAERATLVFDDLREFLNSLDTIEDRELLTLKAHLLLEVSLRRLLAVRLGAAEEDLPRLSFPSLARLVAAGADPERALPVEHRALLLNQIRNDIAHRLSPRDQLARMQELTTFALVKGQWSSAPNEQMKAYRSALKVVIMEVQLIGLVLQMSPEQREGLTERLRAEGGDAT